MKISRALSLIFSHLLAIPLFAWQQPDYSFQQDDTVLREKYRNASLKKKEDLIGSLPKLYAKDYTKVYEEQYEQISSFWNSHRAVTDPVVNGYLQQVVQRIVQANPVLKDLDMRVVFSRDWWPNAVSMGDGTIAINAGLFIFLQNEAELAFVVGHEIAHYYLRHSPEAITNYVERINSPEFQAELKRLSKEEYRVNQQLETMMKSLAFDTRRHSRDKEAEADRTAFQFLQHTDFDGGGVRTCLQLLDRIDDSLYYAPQVTIDRFFSFPDYPFRKKWIQQQSSLFSSMSEEDSPLTKEERDSLKTHPDCAFRISLLEKQLRESAPGKTFLVNESLFLRLKKDFYVEMTEECYRQGNLSRNLYFNLLLLENEPENRVAVYSIARCWNQLYEYQRDHKLGNSRDLENKTFPPSYNLLLRMLDRIRLEEIAGLNAAFCKKYEHLMNGHTLFRKEWARLRKIQN